MKKILTYLKFARILNCILAGIIVLFSFAYVHYMNLRAILLSLLIFVAGTAFANISNDLRDFKIDLVVHPERPLVSGEITHREAFALLIILSALVLVPAAFLGERVFIFVLSLYLLTLIYNLFLKRHHFWGNLAVALISSATFFIAGVITGRYKPLIFPFILSFFFQLYREILKDLHDMEGDKIGGYRTIPLIKGEKLTIILSQILLGSLIILTLLPGFLGIYGKPYLWITIVFVDIPLILVGLRVKKGLERRKLKKYLDFIKIPIMFVLIAIYLGG